MTTNNALRAAYFVFLAAVIFAGASIFYVKVAPHPAAGVLGDYPSPRMIATTRPGASEPATTEVGMLLVRGRRCIHGERTVTVEQYASYHEIADEIEGRTSRGVVLDGTYGDVVPRDAGCFVQDLILALPAGVTPGRWYLDVIEVATATGEIRRWTSEAFTVVPR